MDIKNHFGLIILISIVLGLLIPGPGLFLKPYAQYLLMLLMFVSCLKINWREVVRYLKDIRHVEIILCIIHVLTALIAIMAFKFFSLFSSLSNDLFLGLIIVAVAPAGLSSVFLSVLAKGKPAEALAFASVSNLLSPFLTPFLIFVFVGAKVEINFLSMVWLMLKLVILPFFAAQLANRFVSSVSKLGNMLSLPVLVAIIWAVTSPMGKEIMSFDAFLLFLIASVMILGTFIISWAFAPSWKEGVTYSIVSTYKNFTLSTVVALTLFNPVVALPSVIYTLANNLWLIPMFYFFGHHGLSVLKWR
ncbi:MAG: bile acid:sodium symporter [Nanoarchaeota archaeon]